MLREFFVNTCIIIAGLFIGKELLAYINGRFRWGKYNQITQGVLFGILGSVLLLFSIEFLAGVPIDLRNVVIILSALYGGLYSSIVTSFIIALARILFFEYSDAMIPAVLTLGMVGLVCGMISKFRVKLWKSWLTMSLAALTIFSCLLTYLIGFTSDLFVILLNYWGFTILAGMIAIYFINFHILKVQLEKHNEFLTRHDPLTGLINFHEFHRKLSLYVKIHRPFCLVIIDCHDLRTIYSKEGYHSVNDVLTRLSAMLRDYFSDAQCIARYGGDEFALVLPYQHKQELIDRITVHLESIIPNIVDIDFTFGYAFYPEQSGQSEGLISIVEGSVFEMKKTKWLQQEQYKQQAEKFRTMGELAAGMAHEIRNPLTTIKGFLQLSRHNQFRIDSYYDLIMDEIVRMANLTEEFLKFSKPHAEKLKVEFIEESIERVIQLTEAHVIGSGHTLEFVKELSPSSHLCALLDKDKFVQVFLNLIKNSVEAMEQSGGIVSIRLYQDNNHGVIEVRDTGKGIPEHHMKKLFVPFQTTKENGTGLGLPIVYRIIRDHGGAINVVSSPAQGTTFTISIPLVS